MNLHGSPLGKTLGMRHIALNVQDVQRSKEFYLRVFKMDLEWEPDSDNVYLTSGGQDNIALHKAKNPPAASGQRLDHLGFILSSPADADAWYEWMLSQKVTIIQELKTHRDGARSFYVKDPDEIVIQMIYHPPIAKRAFIV